MKSVSDLRLTLRKQWENASHRRARLLEDGVPFSFRIGVPKAGDLADITAVRAHLAAWRAVKEGTVHWEEKGYRALGEKIEVPVAWEISSVAEWSAATHHAPTQEEMTRLTALLAETIPFYHPFLIRRKNAVLKLSENALITAFRVAETLTPGCCEGAPLRTYSIDGVDTKFIEDHHSLLMDLLDLRYGGAVRELGLERFLDAAPESGHWILVSDLESGLLPVSQIRVRSTDLMFPLTDAETILIIENEKCLHHLPPLKNTLVILGAGLNLSWTAAPWLKERRVYYWGDLDTWGLHMLSLVRINLPTAQPILMTRQVYEQHVEHAVKEPSPYLADHLLPLNAEEQELYELLKTTNARLEQEFLSVECVHDAVKECLL